MLPEGARRSGAPSGRRRLQVAPVVLLVAGVLLMAYAMGALAAPAHGPLGAPARPVVELIPASSPKAPHQRLVSPAVPASTEALTPRRPAGAAPSRPAQVRIPDVGVRSSVVPVGLGSGGELLVPPDPHVVGWWAGGALPGDHGPAVLVGHVDSLAGPAVFARLRELRPGAEVIVTRHDDTPLSFRVERIEQHPKRAFPTSEVYGETAGSELRLITCTGKFDSTTGHYRHNLVVYATRTS